MKTLTNSQPLGTATRWRVEDAQPLEKQALMVLEVQLLTNNPVEVSKVIVVVRNGQSDGVAFNGSAVRIADALQVTPHGISTPTGYTDSLAAWRGGATMAARRDAVETWMLSAGVAAANLAGT